MLFSSLTFLFAFLPLTLGLYFLAKDKYKNQILLAASLFFYAWGEPKYIILMVVSIIFNYFIALWISKTKRHKKLYLVIAVLVNIGALFLFKYLNFAVNNLNYISGLNIEIPVIKLPIGISFYTFQILSYVIDVYRKRVKVQKNIFTLGTYIALFPQLIAGPIVRYADIEAQLQKREHSVEKFANGFRRFIVGFLKKSLLQIMSPLSPIRYITIHLPFLSPHSSLLFHLLPMHFKSIMIFLVTATWQLVLVKCLVLTLTKTSTTPILPPVSPTSGAVGTFRLLLGLKIIYIFLSVAIVVPN